MRAWWARQSPERKRQILDARKPSKPRPGRRPERRSPEKHKARVAVHNAIRAGRLVKGSCEVCGVEKTDAHHEDYAKPLDVRWLCRKHHMELHRKYHGEAEAA
jgi:hypothetical protein